MDYTVTLDTVDKANDRVVFVLESFTGTYPDPQTTLRVVKQMSYSQWQTIGGPLTTTATI